MTPEELDEIEARAKAATEGPWVVESERPDGGTRLYVAARGDNASAQVCRVTPVIEGSERRWAQEDMADPTRHETNAAFIASARADIPALVEEVKRLKYRLSEADRWQATAFRAVADLPVGSERAIGHPVADAVLVLRRALEKAEREAADLAGLRDVVARLQAANAALCERLGD